MINIRSEMPCDIVAIEMLTVAAFKNAPHTSHTEQYIVNALRHADKLTVSLVAELNEIIVGHVALSPVSISDGSNGWYGLGPISVAPEHQGRGVGSQLMEQALLKLNDMGASGCVLVGEPNFYSRFGFTAESRLVLPGVPPEYFQVLSFGTETPRGEVVFHEAFNAQS